MSISVIGTLKPKNNGTFPVAEAADIAVSEELRLPEALNAKAEQSDLEELSSELSEKASQSDLTTATANLQAQIDALITPVTQDAEVQNARVGEDGTSYTTLKDRLDSEYEAQSIRFDEIDAEFGNDWSYTETTVAPISSQTSGYISNASNTNIGQEATFSTNSNHSWLKFNVTAGKTYKITTYCLSSFSYDHVIFVDDLDIIKGVGIAPPESSGNITANLEAPSGATKMYVVCNKQATQTDVITVKNDVKDPVTTSIKQIKESLTPNITEVHNARVGADGTSYQSLEERLNAENEALAIPIANIVSELGDDWTYTEESVTPISFQTAGYISNANDSNIGHVASFSTNSNHSWVKYNVTVGKTYKVTTYCLASFSYDHVVFVDDSDIIKGVSLASPDTSGNVAASVVAPSGATKMYVVCNKPADQDVIHVEIDVKDPLTTSIKRIKESLTLTTDNTACLTNKKVKDYYENTTYSDSDYSDSDVADYAVGTAYRKDQPLPVTLKWTRDIDAVSQYVVVSERHNLAYSTAIVIEMVDAVAESAYIWNLVPNKLYYYKIVALYADDTEKVLQTGTITTDDEPVRMINLDGVYNVRDLGGKQVGTSATKYGVLYRGSEFDSSIPTSSRSGAVLSILSAITEKGKNEARRLVMADLDLRNTGISASPLGNDLLFQQTSYGNYASVISSDYYEATKECFDFILSALRSSKPVYIHCQGGCDRTGTLVTLLLGLIGVSENDLSKEYELSSFSVIGSGRRRNSTTYDYKGLIEAIKELNGTTFKDKCETYFLACGVSSSEISEFRSLTLTK